MSEIDKTHYIYTSQFCEENIWKLVESLYTNQCANPIDVLFILNESDSIALFEQNKSIQNKPVIWDYHVILSASIDKDIVIFDFDSRCGFPVSISDYFKASFPDNINLLKTYQPLIKSINARHYYKNFYSDRKHMIGIIDNRDFPNYPVINQGNEVKNLTLKQCRELEFNLNDSIVQLPDKYLNKILNLVK